MDLRPFLMYKTTKLIKVDVWQMGCLYYIVSFLILVWQVESVYRSGTYLLHEPIVGKVNPSASDATYDHVKASDPEEHYDFCKEISAPAEWRRIAIGAAPPRDFVFSPTCETLHKYEVSTKQTDFISFISSAMEFQTYGWPCGEEGSDFASDAIAKCDSGTVTTGVGGAQCTCKTTKGYYTTAVEDYTVRFSHSYSVSELRGVTWSGSSDRKATDIVAPEHPLDTKILMPE